MKLWIGTSGYSYPEWRGSFYPQKISGKKMLAYYASKFKTVEINYTFTKLPSAEVLAGWLSDVPAGFRFTLKAPQRITHFARLRNCRKPLRAFLACADRLAKRRGALLIQLPPNLKKDVHLLKTFVKLLPKGHRAAFEFRHASWFDDEVYWVLKYADAALCIAESEKLKTPFVATTTWGYLRLRDEGYSPADLKRYYKSMQAQKWKDAYVYFKHEDTGKGAEFAILLKALTDEA